MSEQDRPPPTKHAFDRGVAAGRDAERAAVVAWLRKDAEFLLQRYDRSCAHVEDLADEIERGEHRKEEP